MNKALGFTVLIVLLTACGGGSNSGGNTNNKPVTGLSLPNKINAIPASQTSTLNTGLIKALSTVLPQAYTDPGTDFSNDKAQSYVYEEGILYVYLANYLLCYINKLDYQSMVNKGPYLGAVNVQKCYEENFPNTTIQLPDPIIDATVISSRKDNQSPHIIKLWMSQSGAQSGATQSGLIPEQTLVEIEVYQAPNDSNPFGDFAINFSTVQDASLTGGNKGEEKRVDSGGYRAGLNDQGMPVLKHIDVSDPSLGDYQGYQAFTIALSGSSQNEGAIHSQGGASEAAVQNSSFIDYNSTRLLKGVYNPANQNFDTQSCLAIDEPRNQWFGYNLYFQNDGVFRGKTVSAGQRVELNNNFQFTYNGQSGWMSDNYYWLDYNTRLPNGATITKQPSSPGGEQQSLTVFVSPGKFTRYQNVEEPLSALQGVDLLYFGTHPDSSVFGTWKVSVTANNDFEFVKELKWTGTEYVESDTYDNDGNPATPEVPVQAILTLIDGQSVSFYNKSNYNYYFFVFDSTVLAESRSVMLKQQQSISPVDSTLFQPGTLEVTLYCYDQCLKGGLTQDRVNSAVSISDLYYNFGFVTSPVTYTAKLNNYQVTLIDDGTGLPVDASSLDLSPFSNFPLVTGKLVLQPIAQPTDYTQLDNAPTSYTWQTGSDSNASSFVLLDQNNTLFTFDQPIIIDYTYDASHDLYNTDPATNPNHGKTFSLTYFSPGSLSGLPYVIDATGTYFPEIALAPGTPLSNSEGDYVAKAILGLQLLASKDLAQCSSLSVENLVNDPVLKLLTSAEITPVSFSAADKPVVVGAPVVKPEF